MLAKPTTQGNMRAFIDKLSFRLLGFLLPIGAFSSLRVTRPLGVKVIRVLFLITIVAGILSGAACTRRISVPEELTVNPAVPIDDLIKQINAFGSINTLAAIGTLHVRNYFTGVDGKADELPEASHKIWFKRPEYIRMQVTGSVLVIEKKVADMVSDGQSFSLAIYFPSDKRQFIYGSNLNEFKRIDASQAKDPRLTKVGGLVNMRPQHITDSLLIKPIDSMKDVFREEVVQEEADNRPNRKGKRVTRSYYVLYVLEHNGTTELKRKFWFDRTKPGNPLARQQTFEQSGRLASDITYEDWFAVPNSTNRVPKHIVIDRRNDGYRLELYIDSAEVNLDLPDTVFQLKNEENLKEVNLDAPRKTP